MIPAELDLDAFADIPFPVVPVRELRRRGMVKATLLGRDLVVLWNGGRPRVYRDACAHLGLPLTLGTARGDRVRCRYHGWAFSTETGDVVDQPTLRRPQPCRLERHGALVAGDLVFAWLDGAQDEAAARARLPEEVLEGISLFRVEFACPFYLALFSSVDYAHFPFHTGYSRLYTLYRRLRGNDHVPGTAFPSRVVAEDDRRVTVRIDDADRTIHMYASATEMDDDGINFFQTFVQPIDAMRTIYWECYRPRGANPLVNAAARLGFRNINVRLIGIEDRIWTGASAPNFVRGENIHLSENDVPLGAHLRKFVLPRLKAAQAP
jgi:phenylpropionate dioxygenase-like ring-hydroxylating dioxygenase large terminal subunit